MTRTWRVVLPALLLLVAAHATAPAQEPIPITADTVVQVGASDVALDRRLTRLLAANPRVISRDARIPAGDTVRGSVLVLDATLVHEGVITGDLVIVDAGAFVRPRSVVQGDLVNIAGGLYRSEIARIGGTIIDLPTASYRVLRQPGQLVIEASGSPSRLALDPFMGFHPPLYDRVNGLTLVWGARYRLPRLGNLTPSVHGQAGWLTERGAPTYRGSARVRGVAMAVEAGHERGWATNDDWIRGDLRNSLNYGWDGDDYRDYHDSRRSWAAVRREFGDAAKSFFGVLEVRGQVEDAWSLEADEPWHLWDDDDSPRPNPAIDEGRTTSIVTSYEMEWHGLQTDFEGRVEYESAHPWLDGDFRFDRVTTWGEWAMHALADHTLEIEYFVQHPLGGNRFLPRQEWSFVGGSGTLQSLETAHFRGDRVLFVETKYIIPAPERLALPLLGPPDLQLIHAAGVAWVEGEDPPVKQETGARLEFFGLYFRYMIDPNNPSDGDLDIGLTWPFGTPYPWER